MSGIIAEPFTIPLVLSTRLVAELGDRHSKLRAITQRSDSAVVVRAGGEIDACNELTWRRLVNEAAAAAPASGFFVIDLAGLDFMSCSAFQVLGAAAEFCRRRGVELRLVSAQPLVARIVKACGLAGVLPVHPSIDSALGAESDVA